VNRYVLVTVVSLFAAACQTTPKAPPPVDTALAANRVVISSGDGTRISGYLFRPPARQARTAVIMLHGCSGLLSKSGKLKSRERAWRDIFLDEGYVVLLLDSFTERGYRTICRISLADRPVEPNLQRPHDAYGALRWLQTQPFVRPDRVALAGWSNGAMTMLWTVLAEADQRPKGLAHDFRAAIGFYPGCIKLRRDNPRYTAAVPTLLQLGAADNWTWPKPCVELVEVANVAGGAKIEFDAYEGAVHSFDNPNSKRRTITVSNSRRVEIGTDRAARQKAIARVTAYLRAALRD
jgi:dienelactone hydrolase